MKRIGCILLISTIILTGCKTGNKNKNDKENKTAVENRFEKKNGVVVFHQILFYQELTHNENFSR